MWFFLWLSEVPLFDVTLLSTMAGKWGMYLGLFVASFFKFGLAAIAAMGNTKLNFLEILLVVGGGGVLSVPFYTFFGEQIKRLYRRYFKRRKPASFSRRRRIYRIWHRYGIWGAAVLSPIISPMLAVGISVSFQESPRRIILIIGGMVLLWSFMFAFLRHWLLMALAALAI